MTHRIADDFLCVEFAPAHGATITSIQAAASPNLLWRRGNDVADLPAVTRATQATDDFNEVVFVGGWFGMFPLAGIPEPADADSLMHGDMSRVAWHVARHDASSVVMETTLRDEFAMRRTMSITAGVLTIHTTATNDSTQPRDVAWGEHPCFDRDVFGGGEIELDTRSAHVPAVASEPSATKLATGQHGTWPTLVGTAGVPIDASRIPVVPDNSHDHVLVEFETNDVQISAPRYGGGIDLRFSGNTPHAIVWTHFLPPASPWSGDVFAVESMSIPGRSLADPGAREALNTLQPRESIEWGATLSWRTTIPTGHRNEN